MSILNLLNLMFMRIVKIKINFMKYILADVNEDGNVDVTDIVQIVNIIMR